MDYHCRFCNKKLNKSSNIITFYSCNECRTDIPGTPKSFIQPSKYSIQLHYDHEDVVIKTTMTLGSYYIAYRPSPDETTIAKFYWSPKRDCILGEDVLRVDGDPFHNMTIEAAEQRLKILLVFS